MDWYHKVERKNARNWHCVKSVRIRSYSGPCFPAFGLNTDSLRIQFKGWKIRTRITPNTDTFLAVWCNFWIITLHSLQKIILVRLVSWPLHIINVLCFRLKRFYFRTYFQSWSRTSAFKRIVALMRSCQARNYRPKGTEPNTFINAKFSSLALTSKGLSPTFHASIKYIQANCIIPIPPRNPLPDGLRGNWSNYLNLLNIRNDTWRKSLSRSTSIFYVFSKFRQASALLFKLSLKLSYLNLLLKRSFHLHIPKVSPYFGNPMTKVVLRMYCYVFWFKGAFSDLI